MSALFLFLVMSLHAVCDKISSWWSGLVVSALASINKVNLRRARLVLRWGNHVQVQFLMSDSLFRYVTNQPPKANFHPSGVGK